MKYNLLLERRATDAPLLACPLCGGHVYGGETCGTCFAPAHVIESIITRREVPRIIGVLGPSGVGKTVYLGMLLDMLSRGAAGLHGVARGAFSLALHRNLILALERQRFPEKTPTEPDRWHWVHCEVTGSKAHQTVDIVTPDVAGESVMAELECPRSVPMVRALIGKCSALVILVDILQVMSDGQGQELFAMQLISYLASLRAFGKRGKVKVPVAVIFTKADLCEEVIHDTEAFARANAPGLWMLCESRLAHFRFYCSGVAGATGMLRDHDGNMSLVPLRIEPRGIIEPFAWMMTQLQ